MSTYTPPLDDIKFCIRHLADIEGTLRLDAFEGIEVEDLDQILDEAGKFAADVVAPNGTINYPLVGEIFVNGLTLDEAERQIEKHYRAAIDALAVFEHKGDLDDVAEIIGRLLTRNV